MSTKPIFMATHPRACSTAFERVFMTRSDVKCIHEPFGDAFYYGPERLSTRFEQDETARVDSAFSTSTYQTVINRIEQDGAEGKRLFIKDILHYLLPPNGLPSSIAPTLGRKERGVGTSGLAVNGSSPLGNGADIPYPYQTETEPRNPTVIPDEILRRFHFTFLIRHPRYSIPSYFRCTVPPLDQVTGFHDFMPSEAGYDELRRFFDYLRYSGQIGPKIASEGRKDTDSKVNGHAGNEILGHKEANDICVIDADDLLRNPAGVIKAYCDSVGLRFDHSMLKWDTDGDREHAEEAFEKWKGFHDDAIESKGLVARTHERTPKSREEEDKAWAALFGFKASQTIRETVDANLKDYEYLKQFAMKV